MEHEERQLLGELVHGRAILALGVLVDDRPYVGQIPFAFSQERGSVLIHVSGLAKHTRGLSEGAAVSVLIGAEGTGTDPFQIPRVSLDAVAHRLEPSDPEYGRARVVYLDRLPTGGRHFQLGDFSLWELRITKGRFVAGLGRTYNLTGKQLRQL